MPRLEKPPEGFITIGLTMNCPKCWESQYFQPVSLNKDILDDPAAVGSMITMAMKQTETKFIRCPRCEFRTAITQKSGEQL